MKKDRQENRNVPNSELNVPNLRFLGFEETWENKVLKNICTFFSGGTPTSSNRKYYEGKIPFIGSGNIFDETVDKYISEDALNNSSAKLVQKGDVLYALYGANSGDVSISKIEGAINQAILCIRTKENENFLFQALSFKKEKIVGKYLQGGQGNLSAQIIKNLKLEFPKIEEQNKIANFLTLIDIRIETQNKIIEDYKLFKKGLMHKVFNKEINFKNKDNSYDNWKTIALNEVLSIPEKESPKTIDVSKILTVKLHLKGISINDRTDGLKLGATKYIIRKKGQFIYGKQNLFNGAFGIVPKEYDGFLSSGDIPTLNINTKVIIPKFLYYYFGRKSFYKSLEKIASGSGSKRIHEKTLLKLKITIPNLEEQQKIASTLSAIDDKITLEINYLEKLKNQKQYLLQNLFI